MADYNPQPRFRTSGFDVAAEVPAVSLDHLAGYLKAQLKETDVTYAEFARWLREHGMEGETEGSVTAKPAPEPSR